MRRTMDDSLSSKNSRQTLYLDAFRQCYGHRRKAGEIAGVPKTTYCRWFSEDAEFVSRAKEIREDIEEELFAVAARRAVNGDSTILMFLLRALNPQRFNEGLVRNAHAAKSLHQSPLFAKLLAMPSPSFSPLGLTLSTDTDSDDSVS